MHRLAWSSLLALAGCPPPPHYVVADVHAGGGPAVGALVAAHCAEAPTTPSQPVRGSATRTDELGFARLAIRSKVTADRCVLTVALPGYSTIETRGIHLCPKSAGCPPLTVDLAPERSGAPRGFATPPGEVAR